MLPDQSAVPTFVGVDVVYVQNAVLGRHQQPHDLVNPEINTRQRLATTKSMCYNYHSTIGFEFSDFQWISVFIFKIYYYFSFIYICLFQPVLHNWCNKGRGMCYPVYGVMHIKEPLLLIGKSSPCGGSGFPLSLSEWSFTICLMPYNRK